jgi:hypothetical protein
MSERDSRRTFLKHSAAAIAAFQATTLALAEDSKARGKYICVTCGIQFKETEGPPKHCPICEDERQYIGWDGQKWTTLEDMKGRVRNTIKEEESGLHSILTQPKIGIGQRAFLVRTNKGNVLWDCVPQLDEDTIKAVKSLGGIAAIAVLLGHESLETTMIYTHVARQGPAGVTSPLDLLGEVAPADVQATVEATRHLAGF